MTIDFDDSLLNEFSDQNDVSIAEHSGAAPLFLVLLRHFGCPFCRRTLSQLQRSLPHITDCGYAVGIIHMQSRVVARQALAKYNLEDLPCYFDPKRTLYEALGVGRMPIRSLFRPSLIIDSLEAGLKHGASWPQADPRQMPGVFLVDNGHVVAGDALLKPNDTPDFLSLMDQGTPVTA